MRSGRSRCIQWLAPMTAPSLSDHVTALYSQAVEDGDDVADAADKRVLLHGRRLVRLAEPAQIRNDGSHTGLDQRRDLVAPKMRRTGKAVQQQHRLALALILHGQRETIACESQHEGSLTR